MDDLSPSLLVDFSSFPAAQRLKSIAQRLNMLGLPSADHFTMELRT